MPDSRTKPVSLRLQYGKARKKETDESREVPSYHLSESLCCESHEIMKLHQPGASVKGLDILGLVGKVR